VNGNGTDNYGFSILSGGYPVTAAARVIPAVVSTAVSVSNKKAFAFCVESITERSALAKGAFCEQVSAVPAGTVDDCGGVGAGGGRVCLAVLDGKNAKMGTGVRNARSAIRNIRPIN
jgi:hypothetical protein